MSETFGIPITKINVPKTNCDKCGYSDCIYCSYYKYPDTFQKYQGHYPGEELLIRKCGNCGYSWNQTVLKADDKL